MNDSNDIITSEDLLAYLDKQDDFEFEHRIFRICRDKDERALHGGTYQDPLTSTNRQFDIRMVLNRGANRIALAIECKNLKPSFPLMVSRVPRRHVESFHELVVSSPYGSAFERAQDHGVFTQQARWWENLQSKFEKI